LSTSSWSKCSASSLLNRAGKGKLHLSWQSGRQRALLQIFQYGSVQCVTSTHHQGTCTSKLLQTTRSDFSTPTERLLGTQTFCFKNLVERNYNAFAQHVLQQLANFD
jgi:hypothetical protein